MGATLDPLYLALLIVAIMSAVLLHEIAHGLVALYFGDTTAKDNKRLSLNPLRHVDLIGTILFPLFLVFVKAPFLFGWAKPVPVDFARLNNPKRDMVWVALAGPATNFVLGIISVVIVSAMVQFGWDFKPALFFFTQSMIFNFSLMVFNLIPVLPMDGGRILTGLLPLKYAIAYAKTEQYGFPVMLGLLVFLPFIGDYLHLDLNFIARFLSFAVNGILSFFLHLFGVM